MNVGEFGYWLFWLLGALFLGGCLAVTWWGLFGDRARGRRRCPRCWYDLSHSDGRTCPECGFVAAREAHLYRTRRRLTPALLAAIAAALGVAFTIEHTRSRGFGSLMPTRLILVSLPLVHGDDNILVQELLTRGARNQLKESHWTSLVSRCVRGDWRTRPAGRSWQDKYGTLLAAAQRNAPQTIDLDNLLLELPPFLEITADRAWPADTRPCLAVAYRDWWPDGTECRVTLKPEWNDTTIVLERSGRVVRPFPLLLDNPPSGSPAVFEALIERRLPGATTWTDVAERTVRVQLEIDGTLEQALIPYTSETLEEAMRYAFSFGVVKWPSGPSPVRIRFEPRRTYRESLNDVAVGVAVELRRDGELARRLELWWAAGVRSPSDRRYGWRVDYEDEAMLAGANEADGLWTMAVRGDPTIALRAGEATHYWQGEFSLPIEIAQRRNPAPQRDWDMKGPETRPVVESGS